MTDLDETLCKVIDTEVFLPKILGDDQNVHVIVPAILYLEPDDFPSQSLGNRQRKRLRDR